MTHDRWTWAEVDLGAIEHNVGVLRRSVAPADVWAVVKANGYGHGAVEVARAALAGGASGLCVALVDEGVSLREAGLSEPPILVFSHQPVDQLPALVGAGLTPTVYSTEMVEHLANACRDLGVGGLGVHVKVDTGMNRVGADASAVGDVVDAVEAAEPLRWEGLFTHLACADEPGHPANEEQFARFEEVVEAVASTGRRAPIVHMANSAGALAHPRSRYDVVRAGIAVYGIAPGAGVAHLCDELRPALRLVSRVSWVKRVAAGTRVSYGWRHTCEQDTSIATIPAGYADGIPRGLSGVGGQVLIGGVRRPIVGTVTMDQFMVDMGDDPVQVGDEVVLLGRQGNEWVRAEEWADLLGTIGYEVVCGISARVARRYVGPGH